ncbi:MAG TPA: hypothetical protein VH518_15435 [Tepidisphaeraceae bacterium]
MSDTADNLQRLDALLRKKYPAAYATLRPGVPGRLSPKHPCAAWFEWKDGQDHSTEELLGMYRFIPLQEAQDYPREMRRGLWTNLLSAVVILVLVHKALYSWPLLMDASGAGFYFNRVRGKVYYQLEGEQDRYFASFDQFVEFLIEFASTERRGNNEMAEREVELLSRYTR